MDADFWRTTPLADMSGEQWEALCDGCGRCCFCKYITGHGKNTRIHSTRIACDWLDLRTFRCTVYADRFARNRHCTRLTKRNVAACDWLPETCAYRLLHEGKPLPDWHPLVTGGAESVAESGIRIRNAVHERDADRWEDYEI